MDIGPFDGGGGEDGEHNGVGFVEIPIILSDSCSFGMESFDRG